LSRHADARNRKSARIRDLRVGDPPLCQDAAFPHGEDFHAALEHNLLAEDRDSLREEILQRLGDAVGSNEYRDLGGSVD
jgi:hypothetical protein